MLQLQADWRQNNLKYGMEIEMGGSSAATKIPLEQCAITESTELKHRQELPHHQAQFTKETDSEKLHVWLNKSDRLSNDQ